MKDTAVAPVQPVLDAPIACKVRGWLVDLAAPAHLVGDGGLLDHVAVALVGDAVLAAGKEAIWSALVPEAPRWCASLLYRRRHGHGV